MDRIDAPENLRLESRGGVLTVWQRRSASDLDELALLLGAVDRELQQTGVQNLLFDARDAERAGERVQERIWQWLRRHDAVRKVAVVMLAKERERAVRLAGTEHGVRIKVFGDEESARRWLLES